MILRAALAVALALSAGLVHAGGAADVRMVAALGVSFGAGSPVASFQAGSALVTREEGDTPGNRIFGTSGVVYSTSLGFAPLVIGLEVAPRTYRAHATGQGSSVPWGWIVAGTAAVIGVAMAGGSGGDAAEDDGPTDENSCVTTDDNNNPDADTSCIDL